MKILGIETSCDETAVAVLEVAPRPIRRTHGKQARGEEITVLSNVISSQVKLHAKYGGVVPSLAAREHAKNIESVFKLALKKARLSRLNLDRIDLIAVTRGPGLGPSLLVGIAFARTLAWKYDKPLVGVNHLEGHIYSNWLPNSRNSKLKIQNIFPALNLIVSGGHTELVLMEGYEKYRIIGETLDDAVGEAFDKVARLLGLGYPGGPAISARAEQFSKPTLRSAPRPLRVGVIFPRPMEHSKNFNFSYSGLKTAVLYKIWELKGKNIKLTKNVVNELAHAFQEAALDVLIKKTMRATQKYKVKSLLLSGGVSANKELRKRLGTEARKIKIKYSQPDMEYTTDNAAMIAVAGYFNYLKNNKIKTAYDAVEMDANLSFRN